MHGENITVECNHNYELEGNVTQITCNNGTFDRMPKCEPARCKTLPAPPKNGMVVYIRQDSTHEPLNPITGVTGVM